MAINTERIGATVVVKAEGRIDGSNASEFQTDLQGAMAEDLGALVLNFESLSYISSAGLRVLLMTAKTLEGKGAKLALCSMTEQIREVFRISGFDNIIAIHESQADAMASVAR